MKQTVSLGSSCCLMTACVLAVIQPASAGKRCTAEKGLYTVTLSRPMGTCAKQFLGNTITELTVAGRVRCGTSQRSRSTFRSNGCRYRCGPYRQKVGRQMLRFSFHCQVSCGKGTNAALGLARGGRCKFDVRAIARKKTSKAARSSDIELPRDRGLLFSTLRAATISNAAIRRARAERRVAGMGLLKILGSKGGSSGAVADVFGSGTQVGDEAFRGLSGTKPGTSQGVRGGGVRGGGSGGGARVSGLVGGIASPRQAASKPTATRVAIGSLRLSPRLEPMSIQRALTRYLPSIRRCLHRGSTLGVVRLILQVHDTGHPRVIEVRTADKPLARCVERLAAKWRFKPPVGDRPARLTIPLLLSR